MSFLPVVERELRVASRRASTYWNRFGTALVVILVFGWIMLASRGMRSSELATVLFYSLSGLGLVFCIVSGSALTSDCLSEEKREGTLGLLFLTDLKGYDVVLGKLVATSLNAFYRLLAMLPVLAIPLLMGGVGIMEYARVALVLINTLLFSLSSGMLISAFARTQQAAAGGTILLIIFFTGLSPLFGSMLAWRTETEILSGFLVVSPAYAYSLASDARYGGASNLFWISCAVTHGLSWILLIAASLVVPRSWQDKVTNPFSSKIKLAFARIIYGKAEKRRALRERLLDRNPYCWVTSRNRVKRAAPWVFLGAVGMVWAYLVYRFPEEMVELPVYVLTALLLHTVFKCWLGSEATRQFAEDRRSGSLELILSTPLTVKEIVRGQLIGLLRQFGWPIALILVLDIIMYTAGLNGINRTESLYWSMSALGVMVILVIDCFALAYLGMWQGLSSPKANRAAGRTIGVVLLLPWILVFAGTTFTAINWQYFNPAPEAVFSFWFCVFVALDVAIIRWSVHHLESRFRTLATERSMDEKPSWWSLFRPRIRSAKGDQAISDASTVTSS